MKNVFLRKLGSHMRYNAGSNIRRITHRAIPNKKNNISLFLVTILILSIVIFLMVFFERRILPLTNALAKTKAEYITNQAINTAILRYINENDIKYGDLYVIERNGSGDVSSLVANVGNMNRMKSQILDGLQDNLDKMDYEQVDIPVGALVGSDLLLGLGPKIPIKLMFTGSCIMDFKSNFSAAGINQTKHEVYIEVTVTVNALLTQKSISASITNNVPIAQAIIVGDVPQTYITGLDF